MPVQNILNPNVILSASQGINLPEIMGSAQTYKQNALMFPEKMKQMRQATQQNDQTLQKGRFEDIIASAYQAEAYFDQGNIPKVMEIGQKIGVGDEAMGLLREYASNPTPELEAEIRSGFQAFKDMAKLARTGQNVGDFERQLQILQGIRSGGGEFSGITEDDFWATKRDQEEISRIGDVPYRFNPRKGTFTAFSPEAAKSKGMPVEMTRQEAAGFMSQPPSQQPMQQQQAKMDTGSQGGSADNIGPPPSDPSKLAAYNKAMQERAVKQSEIDMMVPEAREEFRSKLIETAQKDSGMSSYIRNQADAGLDAVDRAISIVEENPNLATGAGARLFLGRMGKEGREGAALPVTILANLMGDAQAPAMDLESDANTLFGVIAFRALNEMRQNSPTGGALGQVSNFEISLLKAQETAWNQESSPESIKERLDLIRERLSMVKEIAEVEGATHQAIMEGKDPYAAMADSFKTIRGIYSKYGREAGRFEDGVYYGPDDGSLKRGEENATVRNPIQLDGFTIEEVD